MKVKNNQFIITDSWFLKNVYDLSNDRVVNYPLYQNKIKKEISTDGLIENYHNIKKINSHRKHYFEKIVKELIKNKIYTEIILFGFSNNYDFFNDLTLFIKNELSFKKYTIKYLVFMEKDLTIKSNIELTELKKINEDKLEFKEKRDFLNFNLYKELFKLHLNRIEQLFLITSLIDFKKQNVNISISKIKLVDNLILNNRFTKLNTTYYDLLLKISKKYKLTIIESQEVLEIAKNRGDILYFNNNQNIYKKIEINDSYKELDIIINILSSYELKETNLILNLKYEDVKISLPIFMNYSDQTYSFHEIDSKDKSKFSKETIIKNISKLSKFELFSFFIIELFGIDFYHQNLNALFLSNNMELNKNKYNILNKNINLNLNNVNQSKIDNISTWYLFKRNKNYSFQEFFYPFEIKEDNSFECPICGSLKYGSNHKYLYCLNYNCNFKIDKEYSGKNLKVKNIKTEDYLYLIKHKHKVFYSLNKDKKALVSLNKTYENNPNLYTLKVDNFI